MSLAGNHLLPLRLGEPLRVVSVVRRTRVPVAAATASAVMLRAADILAVVAIAALLGPEVADGLLGGARIPLAAVSALLLVAAAVWTARVVRRAGAAGAAGSSWPCRGRPWPGCSRASWSGLRRLGGRRPLPA